MNKVMNKAEANQEISAKLAKANALIEECEALADFYGLRFMLPWGGEGTPMSGFGGNYVSKSLALERAEKWPVSYSKHEYGWMSSSGSC